MVVLSNRYKTHTVVIHLASDHGADVGTTKRRRGDSLGIVAIADIRVSRGNAAIRVTSQSLNINAASCYAGNVSGACGNPAA